MNCACFETGNGYDEPREVIVCEACAAVENQTLDDESFAQTCVCPFCGCDLDGAEGEVVLCPRCKEPVAPVDARVWEGELHAS